MCRQTVAITLLGMSIVEILKSLRELFEFEKSLKRPASSLRTESENEKSEEDKADKKVIERAHTWFFDSGNNTF